VNFEAELEKLLAEETEPLPGSEVACLAAAEQELLTALYKKNADLSLQVEEIYDLVKDGDTRILQEAWATEHNRARQLAGAAIGLCDMLEDFCAYARQSGSKELEHEALLLWKNSGALLEPCGITRLGAEGERLNPALHTVQAAAPSALPREQVTQVLQSGYRYLGAIARRAVVVVSAGDAAVTGGFPREEGDGGSPVRSAEDAASTGGSPAVGVDDTTVTDEFPREEIDGRFPREEIEQEGDENE
jgi:molecular chaperone GrpE (heat shock protein)